jgi:sulfur dioxygenase
LNTHVHADHKTSTGELKKHFPKMQSILSEKSGARADKYVTHGEKIKAGSVELEARATPGHTNGKQF